MNVDLAPWPSLREEVRLVREGLKKELAHLQTALFDQREVSSGKSLSAFEGRVSQTIAKVDKDVAGLRGEVDERLTTLEKRVHILEERIKVLVAAKQQLEEKESKRPVSALAASVIMAVTFLAVLLIARESLELSIPRAVIIALVVVVVGAAAAHGVHSLGLSEVWMLRIGLVAALAIGAVAAVIIEAGAGSGPAWRRSLLVVVSAAAAGAAFGAVYGFVVTAEERRRRRLLLDAVNGISAAENELRRVIPAETQLLRAAQVALVEDASNNCQIAKDHFVRRAAQLIQETPQAKRKELEAEVKKLLALLEGKIRTHLANTGEPKNWPSRVAK
jgi:hypothetical protein